MRKLSSSKKFGELCYSVHSSVGVAVSGSRGCLQESMGGSEGEHPESFNC